MERTAVYPDPEGLKALSHPVRLRILGLLRTEGGATATTLAARLGLNTGATSYHLRQLAKAGFIVEDDERGNGRDRWWRAAHQATRADSTTGEDAGGRRTRTTPTSRPSRSATPTSSSSRSSERRNLPPAWHDAWDISDWNIRLTAVRAKALVEAVHALVEEYGEDAEDDEDAATS